jgi:hypothetical protein
LGRCLKAWDGGLAEEHIKSACAAAALTILQESRKADERLGSY